MSIKIELSIDEINGVLMALGNLPYAQVQPLIDKIRVQVIPQMEYEVPVLTEENSEA